MQSVVAIAEDGTVLGGHLSSNSSFAKLDIGMDAETDWSGKHERYRAHYPDGYEMRWVDDPLNSEELMEAYRLNNKQGAEEKQNEGQ